jgi:cephalosporin hydroxylase
MDTRVDLDIIGALENTDKSSCVSLCNDYLRHYEAMLQEFRDAAINVIEIGVAGGASSRIWQWFFSQAQIIGIDINPDCSRHAHGRVKIEIGSQTDGAFLARVAAEHPPTIVIDDGSHIMEHMIYSFEQLFPKLLPGGIYIIEDFAGFAGAEAADAPSGEGRNAPEYFLDVARQCFARAPARSQHKAPWAITSNVDSVYLLGHALIMRKKHAERDVARAVATADSYMQGRTMRPVARENLAAYLVRQGRVPHGHLQLQGAQHADATELADSLLQDVVREHGSTLPRLLLRAENFHNAGRTEDARQVLSEAASYPPKDHLVMARLARLQASVGDLPGALKSAEAALREKPAFPPYQRHVAALRSQLGEPQA